MMKALVGYGDKTVEQVMAENKERSADKKKAAAPKSAGSSAPAQSELAKFQAMLATAKPRERPVTE